MEQKRGLTLKVVQNGSKELAYEHQQQLQKFNPCTQKPVLLLQIKWQEEVKHSKKKKGINNNNNT